MRRPPSGRRWRCPKRLVAPCGNATSCLRAKRANRGKIATSDPGRDQNASRVMLWMLSRTDLAVPNGSTADYRRGATSTRCTYAPQQGNTRSAALGPRDLLNCASPECRPRAGGGRTSCKVRMALVRRGSASDWLVRVPLLLPAVASMESQAVRKNGAREVSGTELLAPPGRTKSGRMPLCDTTRWFSPYRSGL